MDAPRLRVLGLFAVGEDWGFSFPSEYIWWLRNGCVPSCYGL
jgi:hypothetical protein